MHTIVKKLSMKGNDNVKTNTKTRKNKLVKGQKNSKYKCANLLKSSCNQNKPKKHNS